MAELWLVDLDAAAPALEALERATPRLSPGDRRRIAQIRGTRERRQRIAVYVALRIVLERVIGSSARGVDFVRPSGGKPHLPGRPLDFSISHTASVALIAVTTAGTVGVDVEASRAIKVSGRRRQEIVAAGAGLAEPFGAEASGDTFLQAWARLEAYAKAHGHGLARVLHDLGLRAAEGRKLEPARITAQARALVRASVLEVCDLSLPAGLYGAFVADRNGAPTRLRRFPTSEPAIRRIATAGARALTRACAGQ